MVGCIKVYQIPLETFVVETILTKGKNKGTTIKRVYDLTFYFEYINGRDVKLYVSISFLIRFGVAVKGKHFHNKCKIARSSRVPIFTIENHGHSDDYIVNRESMTFCKYSRLNLMPFKKVIEEFPELREKILLEEFSCIKDKIRTIRFHPLVIGIQPFFNKNIWPHLVNIWDLEKESLPVDIFSVAQFREIWGFNSNSNFFNEIALHNFLIGHAMVYAFYSTDFYDVNLKGIYIGQTGTIQSRFNSHLFIKENRGKRVQLEYRLKKMKDVLFFAVCKNRDLDIILQQGQSVLLEKSIHYLVKQETGITSEGFFENLSLETFKLAVSKIKELPKEMMPCVENFIFLNDHQVRFFSYLVFVTSCRIKSKIDSVGTLMLEE